MNGFSCRQGLAICASAIFLFCLGGFGAEARAGIAGKSIHVVGWQQSTYCGGAGGGCRTVSRVNLNLKIYISQDGRSVFDYGQKSNSGDVSKIGVKNKYGQIYTISGNRLTSRLVAPNDNRITTYQYFTINGKHCSYSYKTIFANNLRRHIPRVSLRSCTVRDGNSFAR